MSGKNVELAKGFRISDYREAERKRDSKQLISFLRQRFRERYLEPLKAVPQDKKNGFAMMAVAAFLSKA